MKKKGKKEITVLPKVSASEQESVDFSYLNYLCVSESTVLDYLQSWPSEEVEAKPEKSATALA